MTVNSTVVDPVAEVTNRFEQYCAQSSSQSGTCGFTCQTIPSLSSSSSSSLSSSPCSTPTTETSLTTLLIQESIPPSQQQSLDTSSLPLRLADDLAVDLSNVVTKSLDAFSILVELSLQQESNDETVGRDVVAKLQCYRNSVPGQECVQRFCTRLEGEICRTNRRWRRLLARQETQQDK